MLDRCFLFFPIDKKRRNARSRAPPFYFSTKKVKLKIFKKAKKLFLIVQALNYQKLYNRKYEKDKEMRTRYTQIEILLCLFDCKCHTISEIRNKTGYGESTIRRHIQELSIYLPIEIYKGSRKGVQGGGGVCLEKNFLLRLLFEKYEIELLIRSLENILENDKAQKLKEKIERMLGSK